MTIVSDYLEEITKCDAEKERKCHEMMNTRDFRDNLWKKENMTVTKHENHRDFVTVSFCLGNC